MRVFLHNRRKAFRRRFIAWRVAQMRKGIQAELYERDNTSVPPTVLGYWTTETEPMHWGKKAARSSRGGGGPMQPPLPAALRGPEPRLHGGKIVPLPNRIERVAYARAWRLDDNLRSLGPCIGDPFEYDPDDLMWKMETDSEGTPL